MWLLWTIASLEKRDNAFQIVFLSRCWEYCAGNSLDINFSFCCYLLFRCLWRQNVKPELVYCRHLSAFDSALWWDGYKMCLVTPSCEHICQWGPISVIQWAPPLMWIPALKLHSTFPLMNGLFFVKYLHVNLISLHAIWTSREKNAAVAKRFKQSTLLELCLLGILSILNADLLITEWDSACAESCRVFPLLIHLVGLKCPVQWTANCFVYCFPEYLQICEGTSTPGLNLSR